MSESIDVIEPGATLLDGRFEVAAEIGRGSIGSVFKAYDRKLETDVALKTLIRVTPEYILSLKNEFRVLASISHRNLVQFYELFAAEEPYFISMELLDDVNLLEYVWGGRDFPGLTDAVRERVQHGFTELAAGVMAIHQAGQMHRDIKPSNTKVTDGGRVVILDFGLTTTAYSSDEETRTTGVGTPRFWAPSS